MLGVARERLVKRLEMTWDAGSEEAARRLTAMQDNRERQIRKMVDHTRPKEEQKWCRGARTRQKVRSTTGRSGSGILLCDYYTKWTEERLTALHQLFKTARLRSAEAVEAFVPATRRRRKHAVLVGQVPADIRVSRPEDAAAQAAVLLQSVLRGRAAQTHMWEGLHLYGDVVHELMEPGAGPAGPAGLGTGEGPAPRPPTPRLVRDHREQVVPEVLTHLAEVEMGDILEALAERIMQLRMEERQEGNSQVRLYSEKQHLEQRKMKQRQLEKGQLEQEQLEQGKLEQGLLEQGQLEQGLPEQGLLKQGQLEHGLLEQGLLEQDQLEQGQLEQGLPEQGLLEQGQLEQGLLEQGLLEQGQLEQGLLEQGLLEQGQLEQGLPEQGLLEQGQLEHGLLEQGLVEQDQLEQRQLEQGLPEQGLLEQGQLEQGLLEQGLLEQGQLEQGKLEYQEQGYLKQERLEGDICFPHDFEDIAVDSGRQSPSAVDQQRSPIRPPDVSELDKARAWCGVFYEAHQDLRRR